MRQSPDFNDITHLIRGLLTPLRIEAAQKRISSTVNHADWLKFARAVEDTITITSDTLSDLMVLEQARQQNLSRNEKVIDLRQLLEYETASLQSLAKEFKAKVLLEGEAKIVGDEALLRQAIRHVMDNAIRYGPGGQVHIAIERDQSVVINVKDEGWGIRDPKAARVPLHREQKALLSRPGRAGLGLAVATVVIEAHEGTLDISRTTQGTIVSITLPARVA